jgi:NhaA family Na+:H+ antiporter
VGLEIKREILVGELASPKKALLPVIAAIGGMLVPGLIYLAFNFGSTNISGWGIPMATDIAFALGAIALFGRKLLVGLRIFLAAFAIADDLGAVFIIALFYTKEIVLHYVIICVLLVVGLVIANLLWVRWVLIYAVLGLAIWVFILGSGIHPSVAGVIVSLFMPERGKYDTDRFLQNVNELTKKFECEDQSCGYSILLNQEHLHAVHALELACHDVETPLQRLLHSLHPWVAFLILPFFALSNTGLMCGKPIGITLCSFLAVKFKAASLPEGVRWSHISGAAMLGGIGFTMSLLISDLSFSSPLILNYTKMAILSGSVLSAIVGISFLSVISAGSQDYSGNS